MVRNDDDACEVRTFVVMLDHLLSVSLPRQMAVLVKDDVPNAGWLLTEEANIHFGYDE
jgi:hypothetical protein